MTLEKKLAQLAAVWLSDPAGSSSQDLRLHRDLELREPGRIVGRDRVLTTPVTTGDVS